LVVIGLALTLFVYWPGMQGGFYFDDLPNIVQITPLHWTALSWDAFKGVIDYGVNSTRVLANLSFAINHLFGGLDPSGYHWTNLVIHLLVGMALLWVAILLAKEQCTRDISASRIRLYAVAVVILFLVHPLNIQAVTYVVQRMTSLSTLFVLLAFGCYLQGRRQSSLKVSAIWLFVSLVCWIMGLLCKEIAIMLPLVLVLYELCFHLDHWRSSYRSLVQRFGQWQLLLGMLFVVSVMVYVVLDTYYAPHLLRWSELLPGRDYTGEQRVLTQARIQFFYLGLLLWPAPSRLNLEHDYPLSLSFLDPWTTLSATLGWLVIFAGVFWLVRRNPRYGFPLMGYIVFHLLESAPINLELIFEHRMYLPSCFLVLLLTNLLVDYAPRIRYLLVSLLLILVPLSAAAYERNLTWGEPLGFMRDCATKSPNKYRPSYNLGTALGQAGQLMEAEKALLNALRIKPGDSLAHNQLGNVYLLAGRPEQAFRFYRTAYESDATNYEAMFNLATLYMRRGDRQKAIELFRRFVDTAPSYFAGARRRALGNLQLLGVN
jgi:Ca2+/Na+ antiporter